MIWRRQETTRSAEVRESAGDPSLRAAPGPERGPSHAPGHCLHPQGPIPHPISSDPTWAWAALGEPTQSRALEDP